MEIKDKKVSEMDQTTNCQTTVVSRESILLSCSACGPVGVYLCGSEAAVLHHLTTAHEES